MWRGVRCTDRRITLSSRSFARPRNARFRRLTFFSIMTSLLLLRFLELDALTGITNALALVGLGRAVAADLPGDLPDALLVRALHHDLRLRRRLDRDALRRRVDHRVGEAERQVQVAALRLRAIADANELELALVAPGHAQHDVRQVRAQRTGVHQRLAAAFRRLDAQALRFLHDLEARPERQADRALGALHRDRVAGDRRGDTLRQRNRHSCDS